MNLQNVINFLGKLEQNNTREWFQENKQEFENAKEDFTVFIDAVIKGVSEFDRDIFGIDAKNSLFRIYRDIRFSKDKTPYKTHFGAYIAPGGKKSDVAGYYVHIDPFESFLAGGLYKPSTGHLLNVRTRIMEKTKDFVGIVEDKQFRKYFRDITETDKLKTAPRGFPKDHEALEYLRLKNLIAVRKVEDETVTSAKFLDETVETFEILYDLIRFIRKASG